MTAKVPRSSSPTLLDDSTRIRLSKQARSNTGAEIALRKELWRRGFRYSLHRRVDGTRRSIDIALVKYQVAVFVDGCFWHSCPRHGTAPKNNRRWWREKLGRNIERDRETDRLLKSQGWRVVRVWEHESTKAAANKVERGINRR